MPTPHFTALDVERLSLPNKQVELIRGQLVVREPPSTMHGLVAGNFFVELAVFVRRHGLGVVLPQDTGFKIATDPDSVRAPDVAFVARERAHLIPATGYAALAPDLVIEVQSPSDASGEILSKVADWLTAGVKLVWLVDPRRIEVRVYRADGSVEIVRGDGLLDGEDVLPGFSYPLSRLLA